MDSQGRAHCSNVLTAAFTFLGLTQVSSNFRPSVVTSARWCHHINPSMATESSPSQEPRLHKAQEPNVSHTSHPTDLHKPPPLLYPESVPQTRSCSIHCSFRGSTSSEIQTPPSGTSGPGSRCRARTWLGLLCPRHMASGAGASPPRRSCFCAETSPAPLWGYPQPGLRGQ